MYKGAVFSVLVERGVKKLYLKFQRALCARIGSQFRIRFLSYKFAYMIRVESINSNNNIGIRQFFQLGHYRILMCCCTQYYCKTTRDIYLARCDKQLQFSKQISNFILHLNK